MPDSAADPAAGSIVDPVGMSWHPPQAVLEIAELVLTGALPAAPGIVEVPAERQEQYAGGGLTLEDAEGTPVAAMRRVLAGDGSTESLPLPEFTPLRPFTHGPVRPARRAPAQVRAELDGLGGETLAVAVTTALTTGQVLAARERAARAGQNLLWIAVVGAGRTLPLPADGLWRAVRDVAAESGPAESGPAESGPGESGPAGPPDEVPPAPRSRAVLVAVPLLPGTHDAELLGAVARAHGAGDLLTGMLTGVVTEVVTDVRHGDLHPAFAREYERAVPPPHRRGLTVFFTGLSGSGKSTVAKALADRLLDRTARTVSLLDGDEVRRMLSAGLTFSRADRDLNIRRIGFVAAEVTRHGGLAVCAPIAPFESVRAQVRDEVESVGDFVLVHISTPLAECERRDRKGLYAKARRGEIPDFTGISSPYEEPVDPELRIDTTDIDVAAAVGLVWELLARRGYLTPPGRPA